MEPIHYIIFAIILGCPILYYVVRAAVEDGVVRALVEFEKIKQENKD